VFACEPRQAAKATGYPEPRLQGTSRFDVITQPTATIQYRRLRSAGHALFTSTPLAAELQIVGWEDPAAIYVFETLQTISLHALCGVRSVRVVAAS
jgi:hypothetical protein